MSDVQLPSVCLTCGHCETSEGPEAFEAHECTEWRLVSEDDRQKNLQGPTESRSGEGWRQPDR